ncbi:MAG: enoyl-CoA hydratase [Acidobacteriota bacterium]
MTEVAGTEAAAKAPAFRQLELRIEGRVARLTLAAPRRRNALDLAMVQELVVAMDHLEGRDDVGALIVTGQPPAFCAGADLSQLEGSTREGLRRIYAGFLRVASSDLPTIAAVNGPAVGAGLNLALACDLRLAARSARFDARFVDLGLHPGGGATWMLRQIGGGQLTTAMILFGQALDGEQAAARGLAWESVDDDDLLPRARELAAGVAAAPRALVAEIKATLRDGPAIPSHAAAVERELGPQAWSVEQPAFQERLAALRRRIAERRAAGERSES